MRLDKLSSADNYIKSFKERQEIRASAFHITQVHPEQPVFSNPENSKFTGATQSSGYYYQ